MTLPRGRARRVVCRDTRDHVLDNITLYWLTNTGISSSHECGAYHMYK